MHSGVQLWIGNQAYLGVYFENELKYKEASLQSSRGFANRAQIHHSKHEGALHTSGGYLEIKLIYGFILKNELKHKQGLCKLVGALQISRGFANRAQIHHSKHEGALHTSGGLSK